MMQGNPGYQEEQLKKDLLVRWLVQLQERQAAELQALENGVANQVIWIVYLSFAGQMSQVGNKKFCTWKIFKYLS